MRRVVVMPLGVNVIELAMSEAERPPVQSRNSQVFRQCAGATVQQMKGCASTMERCGSSSSAGEAGGVREVVRR